MNSKDNIIVCGSITKMESLVRLKDNILAHTSVAEANLPYSNYYGSMPGKSKPNSIFMFTERYYSLEDALRFTQNIEFCANNKVNVASAVMQFSNNCHPAIRIKYFPDYEHLIDLQGCYIEQGVKFARKVNIESETMVTVNKCFELKKAAEGIYFDEKEKNEGYIVIDKYLDFKHFEKLLKAVWNNGGCRIFDGAMGGLVSEGKATSIIRIYSEHLDLDLLNCVKKDVLKQIKLL